MESRSASALKAEHHRCARLLAERAGMRSAANISQQLRRAGMEPIKGKVPKRLTTFVERAMDQI